jgi:hypothetical protein
MFEHYHICVLYSDLTFHLHATTLFTVLLYDANVRNELVMISFKSYRPVNKVAENIGFL